MDIREFNKGKGTRVPAVSQTIGNVTPEDTAPVDDEIIATKSLDEKESKTYIEETKEELKAEGYEDELFMRILDELVTKGQYTWEFSLFGRVPCKFRIRPDWVRKLLLKIMEQEAPGTIAGFTDTVNRYNLAGSLQQMGDTVFELGDEASFKDILAHIQTLPFVVVNQLVHKLVIFDKIITVATSPEAIKAFTKPQ